MVVTKSSPKEIFDSCSFSIDGTVEMTFHAKALRLSSAFCKKSRSPRKAALRYDLLKI